MKKAFLILFPLSCAAIMLVCVFMLYDTEYYQGFFKGQRWFFRIIALAGSLIAAFSFRWREYLNIAWLFVAGCMSIFVLLAALMELEPLLGVSFFSSQEMKGFANLVSNTCWVIGIWMLSKTWKEAGLLLPGSKRKQLTILVVTIAVVLVLVGPIVYKASLDLIGGDLSTLLGFAASIGDGISLCLVAPLLLTAFALRGGILGWPYFLLSISVGSWLLNDAMFLAGSFFTISVKFNHVMSEITRCFASTFLFSAGLAQYLATKITVGSYTST